MAERLDDAVKAWREVPEAERQQLRRALAREQSHFLNEAAELERMAAGAAIHAPRVAAWRARGVAHGAALALLDAAEEETP